MAAKLNPNKIKTRDHLMVKLINGFTRSGPHVDRKRQAKRNACRKSKNQKGQTE